VVQPDVLYLSAERRERAGERIEGAPDLVVEVLSPATVQRDRGEKLQLYAASGIREYWLVDPEARQIEFLVARDGRFQVAPAVDGVYRSESLPEIEWTLADLCDEVARRV
jgi:Uma2 family endonuclease